MKKGHIEPLTVKEIKNTLKYIGDELEKVNKEIIIKVGIDKIIPKHNYSIESTLIWILDNIQKGEETCDKFGNYVDSDNNERPTTSILNSLNHIIALCDCYQTIDFSSIIETIQRLHKILKTTLWDGNYATLRTIMP